MKYYAENKPGLLEQIEEVSEIRWDDGEYPTEYEPHGRFVYIGIGAVLLCSKVEYDGCEKLSNADFISKCAELKPKKAEPASGGYYTENKPGLLDQIEAVSWIRWQNGNRPTKHNYVEIGLIGDRLVQPPFGAEELSNEDFIAKCAELKPKDIDGPIWTECDRALCEEIERVSSVKNGRYTPVLSTEKWPESDKIYLDNSRYCTTSPEYSVKHHDGMYVPQSVFVRECARRFPLENTDNDENKTEPAVKPVWQPTEQDISECCGVWIPNSGYPIAIKMRPQDLKKWNSRLSFDAYKFGGEDWTRIEPIPEQCIPKPEPVRERYSVPFPMLAGVL